MSTTMIVLNVISVLVIIFWIVQDIRKKKKMEKAKIEQQARELLKASEDSKGGDD